MNRTEDERVTPGNLTRRGLLRGGLSAAAIEAALVDKAGAAAPPRSRRGQSVIAGAGVAEVSVEGGTIAGYIRKGIHTFKGVPYAASTGEGGRFRLPSPVVPWSGVRSSRHLGPVAPQPTRNDGTANDEEAFLFDWNDATRRVYAAGQSEDCLRLNVWTPSCDGKKRAVMVWIHGGGWTNGSSGEQPAYDGENLSRRGDVVVMSVNHRLGPLGFLDLGAYGAEFEHTSNLGLLDLVTALRWTRDNIRSFGGDPENVTIFGQSGGGAKVGMLTGMPAAQGLFHRAIIQSGSMLQAQPQSRSRELAEKIVRELGLSSRTVAEIRERPAEELIGAAATVLKAEARRPAGERLQFGPTLDGRIIPQHPYSPISSSLSANVPIMVGSTLNEFAHGMNRPTVMSMTEADLQAEAFKRFGAKAPAAIRAASALLPNSRPFERWSILETAPSRTGALRQCAAKAASGSAPAYLYWFTWKTPLLDERPGAFHCADIPFVFDNTERCDTMTGGGDDARALAARMSDSWIAFAKTGNPNHAGIPEWSAFNNQAKPTMVFDDVCRQQLDPDRELLRAVSDNG